MPKVLVIVPFPMDADNLEKRRAQHDGLVLTSDVLL